MLLEKIRVSAYLPRMILLVLGEWRPDPDRILQMAIGVKAVRGKRTLKSMLSIGVKDITKVKVRIKNGRGLHYY
jgi:hypothetical protein